MHFGTKREMKHTKIEIIPMIDTMFFLLVFFVLASLNIIDLRGLNLDLPPALPGKSQVNPKDVKLEIEIDKAGNKTVLGTAKQLPVKVPVGKSSSDGLIKVVQGQLGRKPTQGDMDKITLTISPNPDTAHENVIQAVDDARGAKLEKFSIR